jgi:glycosyltransferase involved in cell wall biosynthesis
MPRALLAFEPPDGGVAENVAQLALGLRAHGWEPAVAGPPAATPYQRLEAAGVPVHRLPLSRGFGSPRDGGRALRALSRLLDSGVDLLHAHSSKAGAIARGAALRRGVPAVYSPHCFAFVGEVSHAQRLAAVGIERALGRTTAAIVCVCEDERRQALAAHVGRPERLHVVYNGVDGCPEGVEPDPDLAEMRARGPVVAAIAVLRRQKRLDRLIAAAPAILAAEPTAQVAIIGNGPEQADLEREAAARGLDREPRFRMLPFSGSSWRYLKALDVFVLPSQWEAFPIGVLEALACGVPQVATDVGGTAEAVGDRETGLLTGPSPEALAANVVELLADPTRRAAMAAASRERQADRFTVSRMVSQVAELYDRVAGGA